MTRYRVSRRKNRQKLCAVADREKHTVFKTVSPNGVANNIYIYIIYIIDTFNGSNLVGNTNNFPPGRIA